MTSKYPIYYYGIDYPAILNVAEFIKCIKEQFDEEQQKQFIEYAKKELL